MRETHKGAARPPQAIIHTPNATLPYSYLFKQQLANNLSTYNDSEGQTEDANGDRRNLKETDRTQS